MSIKQFSILAKLGQGSYSSVYKVERLADHKEYALKKVKLANLSEKEIENAINEVRILASINNPNIIGYKQAFLEGKNLCLIMEFADGGDLYQKILQRKKKNKPFQENQIWNVLIQVSRGLKNLHDMKIFHRDLKSANVFLTKDEVAKLGDLNVSKLAKNGLLYTQTGTPYYASPEVWKDKPYDTKSDIWSFGCVIYEMTTFQPPFKAEDMEGLFESVTKGVYEQIPSFYSKELSSVIKLMLQQNPANRPSCDKLLKSALLIKKSKQLKLEALAEMSTTLLKTIRVPKKLHYLIQSFPKSNYDPVRASLAEHRSSDRNSGKSRQNTMPKPETSSRYDKQESILSRKRSQKRHKNVSTYEDHALRNINYSYDLKANPSKRDRERQQIKQYLQRIQLSGKMSRHIELNLPKLKK